MVDKLTFERVEARRLSVAFGANYVLKRVELSLERAEVLAIRGPNGAGKSTLLRALATLLAPTSGCVAFDGVPTANVRPLVGLRANIGMVSHTPQLYGDLTGMENLLYFARLYGMSAAVAPQRVAAALEQVEMGTRAHTLIRHCSRGMAQRIALARLLLQDAALWLLDEPTTGLDGSARSAFMRLVQERAAAGGMVVLISHEDELLRAVGSRHLELNDGRLVDPVQAPAAPQGKAG
jgi:heme ABC exporter ATP-binding subunit CcmA